MNKESFYLPSPDSTQAYDVDRLFGFINVISVVFFLLIVGLMTYFVIRYRRKSPTDTTPYIVHNTPIEVLWTVVPLILVMWIFVWGFKGYLSLRVAPEDAMDVHVIAQQWVWQFQYPDGVTTSKEFAVPINKPVKLIMISQDVIHSFFVPNFRIKQDVLPNRYTTLWFQPNALGDFPIYCTQYCGTGHSQMLGTVHVMTQDKYEAWERTGGIDESKMTLPQLGQMLYHYYQCDTCHSIDGTVKTGPSFKGIFGHKVDLADGSSVMVDENYVRESIYDPMAKIVKGFTPAMPLNFKTTIKDEKRINALIEFIKDQAK